MSEAEKREVYIACKSIFAGPNASVRKLKSIEKLISQHQATLRKAIPDFNLLRVATTARILLLGGAFESDAKAKAEMPSLLALSPAKPPVPVPISAKKPQQDVPVPKVEVVQLITNDPEEIKRQEEKQTEKELLETKIPVEAKIPVESKFPIETKPPAPDVKKETNTTPKCTTEPSFFPYSAQHSILTSMQQFLEESFFEFTKKWLPSEVDTHQWDCAAVMELTAWMDFLTKQVPKLPGDALQLRGQELTAVFFKIRQIRNTAVHREPIPARDIGSMILDAIKLAKVLQDPVRIYQLKELHNDIQNKTREMELRVRALQDSLAIELEAIEAQRKALDRLEEQLRAGARKSERENKALAGVLIQRSVGRIFSSTGALDDSNGFETADEGEDVEDSEEYG